MPGELRPDLAVIEDDAALDQWYDDFVRKQMLRAGGKGAKNAESQDQVMQRIPQFRA